MTLLKDRLPGRREITLIFTLCFVIIYSWSTLMFFNYLPSWLLFLDGWTIAGIFAYSQVFALFESLVVLAALILVALVMPRGLFREWFVPQGTAAVLLATAGAIALHLAKEVPLWPSKRLLFGLALYLLAVAVASWAIRRYGQFREMIENMAERLTVLLYVYLPFVALSAAIILIRNIF